MGCYNTPFQYLLRASCPLSCLPHLPMCWSTPQHAFSALACGMALFQSSLGVLVTTPSDCPPRGGDTMRVRGRDHSSPTAPSKLALGRRVTRDTQRSHLGAKEQMDHECWGWLISVARLEMPTQGEGRARCEQCLWLTRGGVRRGS